MRKTWFLFGAGLLVAALTAGLLLPAPAKGQDVTGDWLRQRGQNLAFAAVHGDVLIDHTDPRTLVQCSDLVVVGRPVQVYRFGVLDRTFPYESHWVQIEEVIKASGAAQRLLRGTPPVVGGRIKVNQEVGVVGNRRWLPENAASLNLGERYVFCLRLPGKGFETVGFVPYGRGRQVVGKAGDLDECVPVEGGVLALEAGKVCAPRDPWHRAEEASGVKGIYGTPAPQFLEELRAHGNRPDAA